MRKKILFASIVLLAFLATAELLTRLALVAAGRRAPQTLVARRIWAKEGWQVDPLVGWSLLANHVGRRGGARSQTNSLGLRSPEIPLAKPPGVLRVLSIGDSTVLGFGVEQDETFSALLGPQLSAALDRPVEVINAGVAGYSSEQARLYLEHRGLAFDPDIVIFETNYNDRRAVPPGGSADSLEAFEALYRQVTAFELLEQSMLVRVARRLGREWDPADPLVRSGSHSFHEIAVDSPPRVSLERYEANLRTIVALCRDVGATVVFVGLPDNPRFARIVRQARRAMEKGLWPLAERTLVRVKRHKLNALLAQRILNQLYREMDRESEVRDHLPAVLDWASVDGYTPVETSERYLEVLQRIAAEEDLQYVEVGADDPARRSLLYLDYIHLNAEGHAILASALAGVNLPDVRRRDAGD
jgi:lysophospholipase L1-like esterase